MSRASAAGWFEMFSIECSFDEPLILSLGKSICAAVGEADVPFVAGPGFFPPVAGGAPRAGGFGDFAASALGLDLGGPIEFGLDDGWNGGSKTAQRRARGDSERGRFRGGLAVEAGRFDVEIVGFVGGFIDRGAGASRAEERFKAGERFVKL